MIKSIFSDIHFDKSIFIRFSFQYESLCLSESLMNICICIYVYKERFTLYMEAPCFKFISPADSKNSVNFLKTSNKYMQLKMALTFANGYGNIDTAAVQDEKHSGCSVLGQCFEHFWPNIMKNLNRHYLQGANCDFTEPHM